MVNQRTGRRPGESGAREHILSAARATFAERGFEGATIRTIAARARVDPALVLHYFRSKRALFVEAADSFEETSLPAPEVHRVDFAVVCAIVGPRAP